jgi:thioredoxin-related protein
VFAVAPEPAQEAEMFKRMAAAVVVATLLASTADPIGAAEDIGYDAAADPAALLADGVALAKSENKRVLLIAGGDWCIWCHYLQAFIAADAEVDEALHDAFVVVKVYFGDENRNEDFFASWPEAAGYPHFWVFSAEGNLLRTQPTLELEDGDQSYDRRNFLAFIERWSG